MKIELYDMDTLKHSGSILVNDDDWEYKGVDDHHLITITRGMPLKAVLAFLVNFNMVYDIIED